MNATKVILVLLLAGVIALALQHRERKRLERDNETLRQEARQAQELAQENATFQDIEVDWEEIERLRPLRGEVARLRGQAVRLRDAERLDPRDLEEQLALLLPRLEAEQERAATLRAWRDAEEAANTAGQELSHLLSIVMDVARHNDGKIAGSFAELESAIRTLTHRGHPHSGLFLHYLEALTGSADGPAAAFANRFEFLPQTRPLTTSSTSALLLRERVPRRLPDGTWIRLYAPSNGVEEQAELAENQFHEWERQWNRE